MSTFDIIFRGDIVIGQRLEDVKQRLQQLFKTDATKVDALFTGRPTPLKRNLDEATAQKYRDVLLKAGVQVEIRPSSPAGSAAEASAPAAQPRRSGWSLAPVGTFLLTPGERPRFSPVVIDTSRISLRPAHGNLLDATEAAPAPVANVAIPDLEVAAAGELLIKDEERSALPLVEIETEEWDLADVGADLISAEERPAVPVPEISVADYGLAPPGADLGQLKPKIEPVVPNISNLSLVE